MGKRHKLTKRDQCIQNMTDKITYSINVEVASIQNDRPVYVVVVEVLECNVLDVSISNIGSRPALQTSTVLEG